MKAFPHEFSELLTSRGVRILTRSAKNSSGLFVDHKKYFVTLEGVIKKGKARDCVSLLDEHLYQHLRVEQRKIARESITGMTENYEEVLNKTMRIKTAFLRSSNSRSYRAAEKIGLLAMMRSDSFLAFAESLTGLPLDEDPGIQVSCYEHGDYVGPHNDHHPEDAELKNGYVDFHVMFTNRSVAHQYLVYESKGHFSKIVDLNIQGGVSIYKLPFWHYTTPLEAKPDHELEARRWLLLGTFRIREAGLMRLCRRRVR